MSADQFMLTKVEIVLEKCELLVEIGIKDFEKGQKQRLSVSATLQVILGPISTDEIDQVLDYDFIRLGLLQMTQRRFNLQETFCEEVLSLCMEKPQINAAQVYVRKLDVYPDCKSIGVRMSAERPAALQVDVVGRPPL